MRAYIIRRLLLIIPTLFILSILVFLSVRFIPGDVIDTMVANNEYLTGAIDREAYERMLGLDVPVYVQYGRWIGGIVLRGTLGSPLLGQGTVEEKIVRRLPVTIELAVLEIVIGLAIALPVGIYSAIRQDTVADFLGRSVAIIGLATPNFWLGMMVMIYPATWWGWVPPLVLVSFTEDPLRNLSGFLIPSLILGTAAAAATMRMTRTMMLEVLRQDYVRTAWSKGLRERAVVIRHAVKNALIPVVSAAGIDIYGTCCIRDVCWLPLESKYGRTLMDDHGPVSFMETTLPDDRDVALAARSSRKLAALNDSSEPVPARFGMVETETVQLPAPAMRLLREILDQMARGHAVTLAPVHAELTTRQAADLLQVSRTHLVQLLKDGKIPCRKVGSHRRVRTEDIIAYRRDTQSRRRDALNELTAYDQELGLQ